MAREVMGHGTDGISLRIVEVEKRSQLSNQWGRCFTRLGKLETKPCLSRAQFSQRCPSFLGPMASTKASVPNGSYGPASHIRSHHTAWISRKVKQETQANSWELWELYRTLVILLRPMMGDDCRRLWDTVVMGTSM